MTPVILRPGEATYDIPLDLVEVDDRLRKIDLDWVAVLQDSGRARMAAGKPPLIQPVTMRPLEGGRYRLVAGGHRYAMIQGLGLPTIQAVVRDLSALESRLEEIDENLIRRELSALDRATFLAERRTLHDALYPPMKGSKKGAAARWHDASGKLPLAFAEEAARRVGLHKSHVWKILKVFDALTHATRERVAGTWIANNDSQLKALAKAGPEQQAAILDALLREEGPAINVAAALAEVEGHRAPEASPEDHAFAALVKAWGRAEGFPKARTRFLKEFGLVVAPKPVKAPKPAVPSEAS